MFLKKDKKPNGRIYLSIVRSYRDPLDGMKRKQKTIKKIGYADDYTHLYKDPVAHFTGLAQKMTEEEEEGAQSLTLTFDPNADTNDLGPDGALSKNIGFIILSYFYHKLEIDKFWTNRQRNLDLDFSLNHVFQFLVYMRILEPCSNLGFEQLRDKYFFNFDIKKDHIYPAMAYFEKYASDLVSHISGSVNKTYSRDLSRLFYDISSNFYEIDKEGHTQPKASSSRVNMKLVLDDKSIPLTYKISRGQEGTWTCPTPGLEDLKGDLNLDKMVVVADKGASTYTDIDCSDLRAGGYIFSKSLKNACLETKSFVFDRSGYMNVGEGFRFKSRIRTKHFSCHERKGEEDLTVTEKQVVYYSQAHAQKTFSLRQKDILETDPFMARQEEGDHPRFKYVQGGRGPLVNQEDLDRTLADSLDQVQREEASVYDGYVVLVTSELDMPDMDIIKAYRNLMDIEEAFKMTESTLAECPFYLAAQDHIYSHFLLCFVSMVMLRLMQKDLKAYDLDIREVVPAIRDMNLSYLDMDFYLADFKGEVYKSLSDLTGIWLTKRIRTKQEVNSMIVDSYGRQGACDRAQASI